MTPKSKIPCQACKGAGFRCDRNVFGCQHCGAKKLKCAYEITLTWGGRPYKDKSKRVKIPANTELRDGVLVASGKRLTTKNIRQRNNKPLIFIEGLPQQTRRNVKHSHGSSTAQIDYAQCQPGPNPPRSIFPISVHVREVLNRSLDHSDFFEFFLHETSAYFVAVNRICNPFRTIIPQMAMSDPVLMKILMAFGGRHRERLVTIKNRRQGQVIPDRSPWDDLAQKLLEEGMSELIRKLRAPLTEIGDSILASVLVLASFCIFFGSGQGNWDDHIYGAEGIILRELESRHQNGTKLLQYSSEYGPYFFLRRWFTYIKTMGCLSSARFRPTTARQSLLIDFKLEEHSKEDGLTQSSRIDLFYSNGMEVTVLSFLTQVTNMIIRKETCNNVPAAFKVSRDATELDYKMTSYLEGKSFLEFLKGAEDFSASMESYHYTYPDVVKGTNILYCLTGQLQLRRRVLNLTSDSHLVKDLLLKVVTVMENDIRRDAPMPPCLLFVLFSCGCELVTGTQIDKRQLFLDSLDAFIDRGVECAFQAKDVMLECWRTSLPWWEVLSVKGLDICFGT
ncbi:LADA_0B09010g1_1 [Lachancea dasiensis]|uniref:LADA_0B09010g1_1 n=1 Tax=Lachancea dasiensis TaxID=1072105 RepID=A0A1G4IUK5_9SACH|nr:LADA_0B09010g1_1 [Lachancea dasiensis]